ncbi:laccase, multicopper oxidase, benzenediol:oxygen oxidorectuctase [Marasmius sp. AFHP31]|nr:laccase, multicopper oxidase, benzenediol:oxygen oxidorectuctase [Marasmius sp. AFHP31]
MTLLRSLLPLVAASVLIGRVLAETIGPVADLVVHNAVLSPDGFSRSVSIAGDSVSGPLIVAQKGEVMKINVVNNLNDPSMIQSTSIHWHGLLLNNGFAWADGPAFITQCPIVKGNKFLYELPTVDQAGTFWYHSHLSVQYCDGIRGPMVVYDPNDPFADLYDVDNEGTVITLADWYHEKALKLAHELPDHDSVLINGLGRYKDGPRAPLAVVQVEQGKRYRMRVLNIGCQPDFWFHIDKHAMKVIEADGVNHQPVDTEGFRIFAGQRYSYILEANQPVDNYWIRSEPENGRGGFEDGINSAILRYIGAPEQEPADSDWEPSKWLDERDLHPLENPGAPGEPVPGGVDHAINLDFSTSSNEFMINDVKFESPSLPVLLQVLSGAFRPDQLLPKGSVYPLPSNATIEITMTGAGKKGWEADTTASLMYDSILCICTAYGLIPPDPLSAGEAYQRFFFFFFTPQHTFDVVRVAGSDTYNYQNPVRRDVVNSGKGGDEVTIRFVTDNTGPWFLHCHIDWHLETGFAAVFAEAPEQWEAEINPPRMCPSRLIDSVVFCLIVNGGLSHLAAWEELCPIYASLPPGEL